MGKKGFWNFFVINCNNGRISVTLPLLTTISFSRKNVFEKKIRQRLHKLSVKTSRSKTIYSQGRKMTATGGLISNAFYVRSFSFCGNVETMEMRF